MTKTMEMMKATKKLKGFEENSSLLFDYVWTCEKLENGVVSLEDMIKENERRGYLQ